MDTLETNWAQIGLFVVAIITVIVSSVWNWITLSNNRKESERLRKFRFFAEYTKRYQDLILNMPEKIDTSSVFNKDVNVYMRLYFDLCSEEFYLHSQGVIDDNVWQLWTEGIQTAMCFRNYLTAWKLLASYYDDSSFIHFMNDITRKIENRSRGIEANPHEKEQNTQF